MRECDRDALTELYKAFAEAPITLGWPEPLEDGGPALRRWSLTTGPAMMLIDAIRNGDGEDYVAAFAFDLKKAVEKARGG